MLMNIEGIPIKQLWAFLSWLPKFILKIKFTPEILGGLIYVDLQPRHDSATLNLGESANFEIWLQFINLSPFKVELDRAEFQIWCGPILKGAILKRQKIAPGEIISLKVQGPITNGQANEIARAIENKNPISIEGDVDFNCALHPFPKRIGQLSGVKPRLLNGNFRDIGA